MGFGLISHLLSVPDEPHAIFMAVSTNRALRQSPNFKIAPRKRSDAATHLCKGPKLLLRGPFSTHNLQGASRNIGILTGPAQRMRPQAARKKWIRRHPAAQGGGPIQLLLGPSLQGFRERFHFFPLHYLRDTGIPSRGGWGRGSGLWKNIRAGARTGPDR